MFSPISNMPGAKRWAILALSLTLLSWQRGSQVRGHGRLIDPPSRATMWRYGFDTKANYDDNSGYCGGKSQLWSRFQGRCGVCGDPWMPRPRAHERGGRYYDGTPVRSYRQGDVINVVVGITANHRGWMEFRLCPYDRPRQGDLELDGSGNLVEVTRACLDRYPLQLADGSGTRFFLPEPFRVGEYSVDVRLPPGVACQKCLFQWKWNVANSWGTNPDGTSCLGCGQQEQFYACADIVIRGSGWNERQYPDREEPRYPSPKTLSPPPLTVHPPRIPESYPEVPDLYPRTAESYPEIPESYPDIPESYPSIPESYPRMPEPYPEVPESYPRTPELYPRYVPQPRPRELYPRYFPQPPNPVPGYNPGIPIPFDPWDVAGWREKEFPQSFPDSEAGLPQVPHSSIAPEPHGRDPEVVTPETTTVSRRQGDRVPINRALPESGVEDRRVAIPGQGPKIVSPPEPRLTPRPLWKPKSPGFNETLWGLTSTTRLTPPGESDTDANSGKRKVTQHERESATTPTSVANLSWWQRLGLLLKKNLWVPPRHGNTPVPAPRAEHTQSSQYPKTQYPQFHDSWPITKPTTTHRPPMTVTTANIPRIASAAKTEKGKGRVSTTEKKRNGTGNTGIEDLLSIVETLNSMVRALPKWLNKPRPTVPAFLVPGRNVALGATSEPGTELNRGGEDSTSQPGTELNRGGEDSRIRDAINIVAYSGLGSHDRKRARQEGQGQGQSQGRGMNSITAAASLDKRRGDTEPTRPEERSLHSGTVIFGDGRTPGQDEQNGESKARNVNSEVPRLNDSEITWIDVGYPDSAKPKPPPSRKPRISWVDGYSTGDKATGRAQFFEPLKRTSNKSTALANEDVNAARIPKSVQDSEESFSGGQSNENPLTPQAETSERRGGSVGNSSAGGSESYGTSWTSGVLVLAENGEASQRMACSPKSPWMQFRLMWRWCWFYCSRGFCPHEYCLCT